MSPLPGSGLPPQADPVWTREPPSLEESFPRDQVDPKFAGVVEAATGIAADGGEDVERDTGSGFDAGMNDDPEATVIEHLEAAVRSAEEAGMSASELIGLLFYYAHNVAQEARESALRSMQDDQEGAPNEIR